MAAKRVGLPVGIFLLYGVMLLGANLGFASAKVCPFICFDNADYMVCKSSGDKKLFPSCNCCFAGPGCTIYYKNGTSGVCS